MVEILMHSFFKGIGYATGTTLTIWVFWGQWRPVFEVLASGLNYVLGHPLP